MKTERETILSVLFNDLTIFAYVRNTWSLRSLAKCLLQKSLISQSISFKHLQRILKDIWALDVKDQKNWNLNMMTMDLIMMREKEKSKELQKQV